MFQGSPLRSMFNYVQYKYSFVPIDEPGGGGYTVMIHSLSSLWEDFQHLDNIWTASNAGLPLVRYRGVNLYFFQSAYIDYAVEINNCLPMLDGKYTHADIAPNRMILKRHTIKIPSIETKRLRKPYKKVRVKPPPQMQDKWYFQKEICNIPLVMIMATAIDLRNPFGKSDWKSNNITLKCLNPDVFHRHDWGTKNPTQGYFPKPNLYLYAHYNPLIHDGQTLDNKDAVYLGNTQEYTYGNKGSQDKVSENYSDWGNIFMPQYLNGDRPVFSTQWPPSQWNLDTNKNTKANLYTDPFILIFRYNPDKDTGDQNSLYMVPNYQGDYYEPPENRNILFTGFPLFDMIWGYIDWQEKVHEVQNILEHQLIVFRSPWLNEKKSAYIVLDEHILEGKGPYGVELSNFHKNHYYPKVQFQVETLNNICLSGPGCCRSPYNNYLQAKMKYVFKMKWGGCPRTLEKPYDPCSQPDWNIPRNFYGGLQIQNPRTNPQTEIQDFDWRRDYVKKSTIERIKKYTDTDETLQIFTEPRSSAAVLRETSPDRETTSTDSSSDEEETKTLQKQISQLRKRQHKLKLLLRHRLTPSIE